MSQQFWTATNKPSVIKRLNKTLTIPAFSDVRCGQLQKSLLIESFGYDAPAILGYPTGFHADFSGGISIDCWVNLRRPIVNPSKIFVFSRIGSFNSPVILVSVDPTNDIATFTFTTADGDFSTTLNFSTLYYNWHRLTLTWDGTSDLFKIYVDKKVEASVATTGVLVNEEEGDWALFLGETDFSSFNGYIAELKVYAFGLTQDQIFMYGDAPTKADSDILGIFLIAYIRTLEITGTTITGETNSADLRVFGATDDPPSHLISSDVYPPLRYGASFIAAQYPVSGLSEKTSLKFPVSKPTDVDFMLCVSWTDDNGVFQRRRFWDLDGVDIAPFPALYNGEKLGTEFTLECWNIDGNESINLASDLLLRLGSTTVPTSSTDTTETVQSSLTQDTTLAAPFPLTDFPLLFNSIQSY